jgi:ABC-2 type transport system permease protein
VAERPRRAPRQRAGGPWATLIRCFAFVRKEIAEIARQPRLLALLVLGPFALLLMFGFGYSQNAVGMRATFVGPNDSVYEQAIEEYDEQLSEFVDNRGYLTSETEALDDLRDGKTDVVVVFPESVVDTVLAGERATVRVIHDEIDPIRKTAIEVAATMAVQEVNATALSAVAERAQAQVEPASAIAADVAATADQLAAADGDAATVAATSEQLDAQLADLGAVVSGSSSLLGRLSPNAPTDDLRAASEQIATVRARLGSDELQSGEDVAAFASEVRTFADQLTTISAVPPDVLVRPFEAQTETVLDTTIEPTEFFTPASITLLLQHMSLTFAALSLMRDRRTGLYDLLRVGPMSSVEILIGKSTAYLAVGCVVGAALVAGAVSWLDVPLQGDPWWLGAIVPGVVLASLGLGSVMSTYSSTESQAVQWAMLSLLAGLFFGGFILRTEDLAYPFKALSWLLPVTYGIRALQDVMLRGVDPAPLDLAGLAALVVGYGLVAIAALRRDLRPG